MLKLFHSAAIETKNKQLDKLHFVNQRGSSGRDGKDL